MTIQNQHQLIIFARAPVYGTVKQRLAQDIGKQAALEFYQHTLTSQLEQLSGEMWNLTIAAASAPEAHHPMFDSFNTISQREGDLGYRMVSTLAHFEGTNRIIIGSDIPSINTTHIRDAFTALRDYDLVFGPACDGGFWLVGCNADFVAGQDTASHFMKNVRWSTEHALSDTLLTVPPQYRVATVCTLADVDDGNSYLQHLTEY